MAKIYSDISAKDLDNALLEITNAKIYSYQDKKEAAIKLIECLMAPMPDKPE